jgi:hypothetical protein
MAELVESVLRPTVELVESNLQPTVELVKAKQVSSIIRIGV